MTSTNITTKQLQEWDRQGLIPGPAETEDEFKKRVEYSLQLKKKISEIIEDKIFIESPSPEKAFAKAQEYYGINPSWVPIFYSNEKLAPWHGGCAWIFQETEEMPTSAFLQLRKSFFAKETHLNIYHRDELIAHELAHVGRMTFEEPKFEEVIAYQTSSSWLRRWFGPIIQSSREAIVFAISLVFILMIDFFIVFSEPRLLYSKIMWLKIIPLALIAAALLRLWKRQRSFHQCLKQILKMDPDKKKARAMIFRLTDQEILDFSRMPPEQIRKTAEMQKGKSPRWRLLYENYFR